MPRQSASGTKSLGTLFLNSAGMQVRKAPPPRFYNALIYNKETQDGAGWDLWRYLDETFSFFLSFVSWTKKKKLKSLPPSHRRTCRVLGGGQDLPRSAGSEPMRLA